MNKELIPYLENIVEAFFLDFAELPDDEVVPIGRMLIELFEADERGYKYEDELPDLYLTVGEIRTAMRNARAEIAARSKEDEGD